MKKDKSEEERQQLIRKIRYEKGIGETKKKEK